MPTPPRPPVSPAEPEVPHYIHAQQDLEPVAVSAAPRAAESAGAVKETPQPITDEQLTQGRPGKKNARGRRSSVPSWDEIMLGSSRQRD